jgi:hypothetical protein
MSLGQTDVLHHRLENLLEEGGKADLLGQISITRIPSG